jgi:hypothetical protein
MRDIHKFVSIVYEDCEFNAFKRCVMWAFKKMDYRLWTKKSTVEELMNVSHHMMPNRTRDDDTESRGLMLVNMKKRENSNVSTNAIASNKRYKIHPSDSSGSDGAAFSTSIDVNSHVYEMIACRIKDILCDEDDIYYSHTDKRERSLIEIGAASIRNIMQMTSFSRCHDQTDTDVFYRNNRGFEWMGNRLMHFCTDTRRFRDEEFSWSKKNV